MKPTVTISVDSGGISRVLPVPIVAVTLNSSANNTRNILIGYGGGKTLRFEDVVSNLEFSIVAVMTKETKFLPEI